jgi:glycosyltransferase involved in cell wall biosynthesis
MIKVNKVNILFFSENLFFGGKERRLLELISYLKKNTNFSMTLVITEPLIQFNYVNELGIPVKIIKRKVVKYDPFLFVKFYRYCKEFKPDIIHSWGGMTTFYAIPVKLFQRVPLISNLIADAKRNFRLISLYNIFFKTDIYFSDVVLSNSNAGLIAYNINSPKAKVILNGVDLTRFQQNFIVENIREKLSITKQYMIVMVAAFTKYKDYDLFIEVAKEVGKIRYDTSFVAVGDGPEWNRIRKRIIEEKIDNVIMTGSKNEVEHIIAASDIGILTTYSEGISNSILEYMALGKPVVVSDLAGGSKEIIVQGETGYCEEHSAEKIAASINFLLNNSEIRLLMGDNGKRRINSYFSIERMGEDFRNLYSEVLEQNKTE